MNYSIDTLDPVNPSILDWVDNDDFLNKNLFESKEAYINGTTKIWRLSELIDFAESLNDSKLIFDLEKKFEADLVALFNE